MQTYVIQTDKRKALKKRKINEFRIVDFLQHGGKCFSLTLKKNIYTNSYDNWEIIRLYIIRNHSLGGLLY